MNEKHDMLNSIISALCQFDAEEKAITLNRQKLLESVIEHLDRDVFQPWAFVFADESGYGQGVTDEAFALFFDAIADPKNGMFEAGDNEQGLMLPDLKAQVLDSFEMVGRMLLKCLIDKRPVRSRFAPSLFKFLLDIEPDLEDLRLFSQSHYNSGAKFVLSYAGDVSELGIEYTPVSTTDCFSFVI